MEKVFFSQTVGEELEPQVSAKTPTIRERVAVPHTRLPRWIKITPTENENYVRVKSILKQNGLHSVCQEAACPNIRECYGEGTATFMILGKHCTRGCNFCDVLKGKPLGLDLGEPKRLADVVGQLGLKQVVITTVTRDDLPDGGAGIFAETLRLLREQDKNIRVEFLVSDFGGKTDSLKIVLDAGVDVLAHNVETVARMQKRVRGAAKLDRSLAMLRYASDYRPRPVVKTGFMVGLGETAEEMVELMHQIYAAGVDLVTIGQYLRPSLEHLPVEKFYHPDEFAGLAEIGRKIGFAHVEAGPLVRSSYKAFNQSKGILEKKHD
ncbi:MAG: lipoyl synthase [candidate division Zixibacteria bacterium]|nr:lipoyl synthase [candidate division Zixibacteria bacterium]